MEEAAGQGEDSPKSGEFCAEERRRIKSQADHMGQHQEMQKTRLSKEVPGACFSKVQGRREWMKTLRKVEKDATAERQQDPVKIPTSSPSSMR